MLKNVRARFAPSPTGYMHVGNLRTALYTYLIAKKYDGKFILRIEDTDQERYVEGATEVIYDAFNKAGIKIDEGPVQGGDYGPYIQSERRDIYIKYAKILIEKGGAYYCFCDKERLRGLRQQAADNHTAFKYDGHCKHLSADEIKTKQGDSESYIIRQVIPNGGSTSFDDLVYGTITVDNSDLEEGVLIKSDGLPTYNFANVVDDHLMKINPVVRGTEYLSSSPKYNILYEAFGWDIPKYIHLQPVMRTSSKKLSKRDGDASFEDFLSLGYLPEAILNYLTLLGWSPGDEREFFTLTELEQTFEIKGLSKSPAILDTDKMKWMNAAYLRHMDLDAFNQLAMPWYKKSFERILDYKRLSELLHQRTEILSDIPPQLDFIDVMPMYDAGMYKHKRMKTTPENSHEILGFIKEKLIAIDDWNEDILKTAMSDLAAEKEIKTGKVLYPLRLAISGKKVTPGGGTELCYLFGRDETLKRLDRSMEIITDYLKENI